jgi:hypothetical protein
MTARLHSLSTRNQRSETEDLKRFRAHLLHVGAFLFTGQHPLFHLPRTLRSLPPLFLLRVFFCLLLGLTRCFDGIENSLPSQLPILRLGPRVLCRHSRPGWQVAHRYCGGHFVDILTTWPTAPVEVFLKVLQPQAQRLSARESKSLKVGSRLHLLGFIKVPDFCEYSFPG